MKFSVEDSKKLDADIGLLLSSCTDVVSAEVPNELQKIVKAIRNPKEFARLTDGDAQKYLESEKDEAGRFYKEFLKKNWHRALKEFDHYTRPWGWNPQPVVKTIKVCLRFKFSIFISIYLNFYLKCLIFR